MAHGTQWRRGAVGPGEGMPAVSALGPEDLAQLKEAERRLVAREVRRLIAISGLSQRELAVLLGTSASRLSTYATGRVIPSAAMMMRIGRTATWLAHQRERARSA